MFTFIVHLDEDDLKTLYNFMEYNSNLAFHNSYQFYRKAGYSHREIINEIRKELNNTFTSYNDFTKERVKKLNNKAKGVLMNALGVSSEDDIEAGIQLVISDLKQQWNEVISTDFDTYVQEHKSRYASFKDIIDEMKERVEEFNSTMNIPSSTLSQQRSHEERYDTHKEIEAIYEHTNFTFNKT